MKERIHEQEALVIDSSPFSADFGSKVEKMITLESQKFVNENAKRIGKTMALALPLTLSACASSPETATSFNPTYIGFAAGTLSAVEEAFEANDKNFLRKSTSIAVKFASGFTAGYVLSHNLQSQGSWISSEKLPYTIALVPSAYGIIRETKLSDLGRGVQNKISDAKEKHNQAEFERRVVQLAHQTKSPNLRTSDEAWKKLQDMGVDRNTVSKILSQRRG